MRGRGCRAPRRRVVADHGCRLDVGQVVDKADEPHGYDHRHRLQQHLRREEVPPQVVLRHGELEREAVAQRRRHEPAQAEVERQLDVARVEGEHEQRGHEGGARRGENLGDEPHADECERDARDRGEHRRARDEPPQRIGEEDTEQLEQPSEHTGHQAEVVCYARGGGRLGARLPRAAVGGGHEQVGVREEWHDVDPHRQSRGGAARALAERNTLQSKGEVAEEVDGAHPWQQLLPQQGAAEAAALCEHGGHQHELDRRAEQLAAQALEVAAHKDGWAGAPPLHPRLTPAGCHRHRQRTIAPITACRLQRQRRRPTRLAQEQHRVSPAGATGRRLAARLPRVTTALRE
eukprot:scaffold118078_cov63-Phaeocystis_antarctica.AAC.4